MKHVYLLLKVITMAMVLTSVLPFSAKAGPSGSGGGYKYKTAKKALEMAKKDIIEFLPHLSHPSLNEKNRNIIKTALNNLVMEPEGERRYRNGERLFMDYEKGSNPKIIATEGFFEKYSSIGEQRKYGFGKSETYYQIRRDLLHEVAHLILKDRDSMNDPEAAADRFTETIKLNYSRLILVTIVGIYSINEQVNLYEPSEIDVRFGAFPNTLTIKLQPSDLYGTKYSGSVNYEVCNTVLEAKLTFNLLQDDVIKGVLYSIPNNYSSIPCSIIENYQSSKILKGYVQYSKK